MMMVERGGYGRARCDWCVLTEAVKPRAGVEMHEIYNRARTVNNDMARARSFDRHICSLLCFGVPHPPERGA